MLPTPTGADTDWQFQEDGTVEDAVIDD